MKADRHILMIVWDAAEPRLIEQWTADGTLPHLARLRDRGAYGRLRSTAGWLVGSPWSTFFTGTLPNEHGIYHFLQWDPSRMSSVRPPADGRPPPFWHALGENGRRTVALDLPMAFSPRPFHGVELSGWATHDRFAKPASYPANLMGQLRREFGPSPLAEEHYGQESPHALLRLRDELLRSTGMVGTIAEALMQRESWDLFMLGLGATHRGGHKLWDPSRFLADLRPEDRAKLETGLREVYVACDEVVGRLLAAAPEDCTVMVCSLHGMGPNTSRADVLQRMLDRVLTGPEEDREPSAPGFLRRLTDRIPESWRLAVKHRLPRSWQDRLTSRFFMGSIDWSTARAFALVADLHGYVRINVRGRESAGIVEPGAEFDRLCETLIEGLSTFVDADTQQPVVLDAKRTDRLFSGGERLHELPDLLVRWTHTDAAQHREIVSPRHGKISWPEPGGNPDGRSGNHRPEGFLLATGEGIDANTQLVGGHILDLAATIFSRLEVEQPRDLSGTPIPGVGRGKSAK